MGTRSTDGGGSRRDGSGGGDGLDRLSDVLTLGSGLVVVLLVVAFTLLGLYLVASPIVGRTDWMSTRQEVGFWLVVVAATLGFLNYYFRRNRVRRRETYDDLIAETRSDIEAFRTFLGCSGLPKRISWTDGNAAPDGGGAQAALTLTDESGRGVAYRAYVCLQLKTAQKLLKTAARANARGDYASTLRLYYRANRLEVFVYPFLDADQTVEHALPATLERAADEREPPFEGPPGRAETEAGEEARRRLGESQAHNTGKYVRSVARRRLPKREREHVESYLPDEDDPDAVPGTLELYNAARVIHEWNVEQFRRMENVRRFLESTTTLLTVGLFGFAFVALMSVVFGDLSPAILPESVTWRFLLLIPVVGAIGALFSSLFPITTQFYTEKTDPKVPQPEIARVAIVARVLVGAVSAVLLYLIVMSGLLEGVLAVDVTGAPVALLVVAFLGGFSERVLQGSLEKLEGGGPGAKHSKETPD